MSHGLQPWPMQTQRVEWGAPDIAGCPPTGLGSRKPAKPISLRHFLHPSSSCHFLGYFDDFENLIKTLKFRSKIAHSARDIFSLKAKLKIRPTQCHGGCSGLSDDDWHRWWLCVAVVSSWSQSISNFVFPRFPKSKAEVFKICSLISSGGRNQLEIRRILPHAHQQRLSSRAGAHPWRSTTSTPTWPQRDPTFSIWQFTFRPSCDVAVLVSDFSFGGIDLESAYVIVYVAHLGHSRAASASSWPSLSSSSTWAQWCSEFLRFCPIFHFLKSTSDSRQNTSGSRDRAQKSTTTSRCSSSRALKRTSLLSLLTSSRSILLKILAHVHLNLPAAAF